MCVCEFYDHLFVLLHSNVRTKTCVCVQVRLLTGIGRFYEMDYILQLLMENDQFESLLHTGLEKVRLPT